MPSIQLKYWFVENSDSHTWALNVLGLQLPEVLVSRANGQGFLELIMQEPLGLQVWEPLTLIFSTSEVPFCGWWAHLESAKSKTYSNPRCCCISLMCCSISAVCHGWGEDAFLVWHKNTCRWSIHPSVLRLWSASAKVKMCFPHIVI